MDLSDQDIERLANALIEHKDVTNKLLNCIANRIYTKNDFVDWKEQLTSAVLRRRDELKEQTLEKMDKWIEEQFEPQSNAWMKKITQAVNGRIDKIVSDAVVKAFTYDIREKTRATIFHAAEKLVDSLKISIKV